MRTESYGVIIVGGGIAGIAAALSSARSGWCDCRKLSIHG